MTMSAILQLNLHREYFCQIAAGTKRSEFCRRTLYWKKRLENRKYDAIQFRNGCATNAPTTLVEFRAVHRRGKGRNAEYAIRLGRVLKLNALAKELGQTGTRVRP